MINQYSISSFDSCVFERHQNSFLTVCFQRIYRLFVDRVWVSDSFLIQECIKNSASEESIRSSLGDKIALGVRRFKQRENHSKMEDALEFAKRALASPLTVGAIAPSSQALAEEICSQVSGFAEGSPRRILEIGAGTGVFSEEIILRMRPEDHLDIVEYDAELCSILKEKFKNHKNVTIHQMSITEFSSQEKYDHVISGLPLNSLPKEIALGAIDKYKELTKSGGTLSYFEYPVLGKIKFLFLSIFGLGDALKEILKAKETFQKNYEKSSTTILGNLPPARAVHCIL